MEAKAKKIGQADKEKNTDLVLKKHVGLIHCENKLTLIQRKICNILLFNALDKINEREIHEISLKQLCSLVGYNSNDINLIKQSLKSLISVVMEWNLLEDNKFLNEDGMSEEAISWNASALLAGASIKKGLVQYSYSPQIKTVLSSLEIYGRINLFVQAKFNSSYSLVLYENCARFKNIKQTAWFSLPLFRALMGVSKDKYPSFKEFKRNVITIAVNEINQKSDIVIEPNYKKVGRQIVAIQFTLTENDNYRPTFKRLPPQSAAPHAALQETLQAQFQVTPKQAERIVNDYSSDYIQEKITLTKQNKAVQHPGAYLLSALKNDFKPKELAAKPKSRQIENTYLREYAEASQIVSLKKKYMLYKLNLFLSLISRQAETVSAAIHHHFESHLKPNAELLKNYRKKGFFSPVVIAELITFVEQHYPHIIDKCLSFDEYITAEEGAV